LSEAGSGRVAHHARIADGAIVAQFHGILRMKQELAPACGDLKRIAREAGMVFFSETVEPADSDLEDYIKEVHEHATMRTPVLEAIPPPHFQLKYFNE